MQLQSLFLSQPRLFELVVQVLAFAPRLANILGRRPAAIDAMLDPDFFEEIDSPTERADMARAIAREPTFEGAMDVVRRIHREQAFRVGVQVMSGSASAEMAGRDFADLADLCIQTLAPAALASTTLAPSHCDENARHAASTAGLLPRRRTAEGCADAWDATWGLA